LWSRAQSISCSRALVTPRSRLHDVAASAELIAVPGGRAGSGGSGAVVTTLDAVVGATSAVVGGTLGTAAAVGRGASVIAAPVAHFVLRPPLLAPQFQPGTWLVAVARRGADQRGAASRELDRLLDVVVPYVLVEVLRRVDLTATVQRYVDIDALVSGVDLDAVAARLDVDAVAARLNVEAVIERLDLTEIVRERVDIDALVAGVDLDAVAARLDVDAVAGRLNIDSVIDRIDLVHIAQDVISAIDLPEIIRQSTGSLASGTVRGVRMQGIAADEAVGRAVDRVLLRRGRRANRAPEISD
jgi:hypothetical protein